MYLAASSGSLTYIGEASLLPNLFYSRLHLSGVGVRLQTDLCHRVIPLDKEKSLA